MAQLTVPTAGTSPGRAARAVPAQDPGTGGAIADFGAVMERIGTGIEADRLDRKLKRVQVDLTRDVNDLRLQVEQIGDPDAAEHAWSSGVTGLRTRYEAAQGEDGRQMIEDRSRETFGLMFDQLTNATAFGIGKRALELRRSEREASFLNYTYEASRAGASADAPTLEVLYSQGDEQIDGLLASGIIDAEEAARRRIALRGEISTARAIEMVGSDPAGFLAASENASAVPGLSGDQLAAYRVQAQSAVDSAAAAATRQAAADTRARSVAVGQEITDAVTVLKSGKPYGDTDFLADPEVKAHEDYPKLQAWVSLQQRLPGLAQMSPDELWRRVQDERARPGTDAHDTAELSALESYYDEALTGWSQDPIQFAHDRGFAVPTLPGFEASDPGTFATALGQRLAFAGWLQEEGYTDDLRPFSRADKAMFDRMKQADPATRVELAQIASVAAVQDPQTGQRSYPLQELIGDPVMASVGDLITATGDRGLGEEILTGQGQIDAGNVRMPAQADRLESSTQTVRMLLADLPGGAEMEGRVRAATDALYAARVKGVDPASGEIDEDIYLQALHEVMGGTGTYDDRKSATGGVQKVRDRETILPVGIRARTVSSALERLGQVAETASVSSGRGGQTDVTRWVEDPAAFERQMRTIGNGAMPMVDGDPITREDLQSQRVTLQAVGDDQYIFAVAGRDSATGFSTLYDEDGAPFVFSLRKMLREVAR
ncbi:hypothetical protein [Pseudooceanicola algae]|uniref:Uncharacterized protein n=1 Tax=Pseudooceanicola algae TaxID=1537215 RepID=A0A418SKB1_9RHOB|nr:hypothetical protein [Pseudooceanicola algae]QPM89158.1 hypothetical protein PSAL_003690 [Pseudooceanicola algae]